MKKILSIAMLCMMLFANVASAVDLCCVDIEHSASHELEHAHDAQNDSDEGKVACDCCACHHHCETKLFSAFSFVDVQLTDIRTKSVLSGRLFISKITNSLYRPPIA